MSASEPEPNPMLDAALSYAARGWLLLPVYGMVGDVCECGRGDCPAPGKHPVISDWVHRASNDVEVLRTWFASGTHNLGVLTGRASGIVVVDIDAHKGGLGSISAWLKAHPDVNPRTLMSHTGSGGYHAFYAAPIDGDPVGRIINWLPGVDVLGESSYAILPPSRTGKGGYSVVEEDHPDVPSLLPPDYLLAWRAHRKADGEWSSGDFDFASVLAGLPEGERDVGIFKEACRLRSKNVSKDEAWLVIFGAASLCVPPFPVDEARIKLDQAWKYPAGVDPGVSDEDRLEADIVTEMRRQGVIAEARERVARERALAVWKPVPVMSLRDELDVEDGPIAYALPGLHEDGGNSLLVAPAKAGKSTLALNVMKALGLSGEFLGRNGVKVGKVAVWNLELTPRMFRRWLRDAGMQGAHGSVLHARGLRIPLMVPAIQEQIIEQLTGFEHWIIDPFGRLLVGDENSNTDVRKFLDVLDVVKEKAGIRNCFVLHHQGHGTFEDGAEHGRGASVLQDWPDHVWFLSKEKDGTRYLRVMGRDTEMDATALNYDETTRALTLVDGMTKGSDAAYRAVDRRLLEVIRDQDGITVRGLRDCLDVRAEIIGVRLKSLWANGLIERTLGANRAMTHTLTGAGRQMLTAWLLDAHHESL